MKRSQGPVSLVGNLIYLETRLSLRGLDLSVDKSMVTYKSRLLPAKYLKAKVIQACEATFFTTQKNISAGQYILDSEILGTV